jgi:hypothetical protein
MKWAQFILNFSHLQSIWGSFAMSWNRIQYSFISLEEMELRINISYGRPMIVNPNLFNQQ